MDLEKREPAPKPNIYFEDCGTMCLKPEDTFNRLCEMSPLYTQEIFQRLLGEVLEKNENGNITKLSFSTLETKTRRYIPFLLNREKLEELYMEYVPMGRGATEKRRIISPAVFSDQVWGKLHKERILITIGRGENLVYYLSKEASDQPFAYLKSRTLLEANLLKTLTKRQTVTCLNILLRSKLDDRVIPEFMFDRIAREVYVARIILNGDTKGPYEQTKVKNLIESLNSSNINEIKTKYSVIPRENQHDSF
jgi:hypothetical protein